VLAAGEGTERLKRIAAAVQEGAAAYLARQLTLGIFAARMFSCRQPHPDIASEKGTGDSA
jgi:hypothetical protein